MSTTTRNLSVVCIVYYLNVPIFSEHHWFVNQTFESNAASTIPKEEFLLRYGMPQATTCPNRYILSTGTPTNLLPSHIKTAEDSTAY